MSKEDITGRAQLTRNVGASYAGHIVFIVFGFIMPRAIDEQVGQAALGIWDFSWAFVNYLNLAMLGIGSSVNRYVARYRTSGDTVALNRTMSSVVAVQLVIAALVLAASIALAIIVPRQFAERLGDLGPTAGWVTGLLVAALAVQMAFDAWRGVLTGCHRWDYYNILNAGGYAVTASVMLVVLLLGGSLIDIASVYLIATILTEVLRYVLAKRVCPEIELAWMHINVKDAKKVIRFGLKTLLTAISGILTIQTVNVFVVANLGPAALAVLSRPLALASQISSLVAKYAYVLTPAAGSLQSQDKVDELRQFALQSARSGWLITIPPMVFLFFVGDLLVDVWMGPGYSDWRISAILAAGFILPISQSPVLRIMVGLDEHGKIAKTGMTVALSLLIGGLVLMHQIGWNLVAAAALVAVPIGVGTGFTVLYYAFRHLDLGLLEYLRLVLRDGLILFAVLSIVLAANRWVTPFGSAGTLVTSAILSAVVVVVLLRKDLERIRQSFSNRSVATSS